MKMSKRFFAFASLIMLTGANLGAQVKLVEFENHTNKAFLDTFTDGTPYRAQLESGQGVVINQEGAVISTADGEWKIVLEDAHRSGYHRPHWKFHVWLESVKGFPFLAQNRMLYAVVFYDGEGEIKLRLDSMGKLHVEGGHDVKDILYPWAKGTIGRGNPYHEIQGTEVDENGIKYFDYQGFVGLPENYIHD